MPDDPKDRTVDHPPKGSDGFLTPPRRSGLGEDIADRLRSAIILGHFQANQNLREVELAARFEVSRGPIREALARLEREGLVVSRPNRGAVVAGLTRNDIEEVYELRLALERLAVRHAANRRTDEDLAAMAAVLDELAGLGPTVDPAKAAELDVEFHHLIYVAARNHRLLAAWEMLKSQVFLFLVSRNVTSRVFSSVLVAEHQHIRYLIAERNADDAAEVIETHIRGAYDRLVAGPDDDADVSAAAEPEPTPG